MLRKLQNHYYPTSIKEILEFLEKPGAKILAGATALSLENNDSIESLVDLQNANLSYIKDEGEYFAIGAMTSAYDIYFNMDLPTSLREAANCVGDTNIMHAVTIGGNLAKYYTWVSLPPILWALDASFVLYIPDERIMNAEEFFAYSKESNIASRNELLAEIRIPKRSSGHYSEIRTFVTTKNEKSELSLASSFDWDEHKKLVSAKIILSGAKNYFQKLESLENAILDTTDLATLEPSISSLVDSIDLISSFKTTLEYRRHILTVYLKRCVSALNKQLEE